MNRRRLIQLTLLATALCVGGGRLAADGDDDDDDDEVSEQEAARAAVERAEILPLVSIIAVAMAEVPGEVVEVELERDDGRLTYELKVLTPTGRVREVEIDARTGTILEIEDD